MLSGCETEKRKFTDYTFDYFDTATTIIGFEESEEEFKENCIAIKKELEKYHKLFTIYSRYDNLNNITTINEVNGGEHKEVKVDVKIIEMLDFARQMYDLTDGKVNVAMGSVLSIWHEYREEGLENPDKAQLPSMVSLQKAAKHTDIKNLVIDKENCTVFLQDGEMTLDVGAIAKGYAVEKVALWMKEKGFEGYLLNVGGNIRAVGKREDGKKWQIGIENPDTENVEIPYIEKLELENMSLVTSGSYQRYYTVKGKNYHHIIDPDTLMPSVGFKSVSVLCESSAVADALSTALFTMSFQEGKKMIKSLDNTYVMWVTEEGERLYSEGFKDFCKKD